MKGLSLRRIKGMRKGLWKLELKISYTEFVHKLYSKDSSKLVQDMKDSSTEKL